MPSHLLLLQLALQIHGIRPGPLSLDQRDVQVPAATGREARTSCKPLKQRDASRCGTRSCVPVPLQRAAAVQVLLQCSHGVGKTLASKSLPVHARMWKQTACWAGIGEEQLVEAAAAAGWPQASSHWQGVPTAIQPAHQVPPDILDALRLQLLLLVAPTAVQEADALVDAAQAAGAVLSAIGMLGTTGERRNRAQKTVEEQR